VTHDGTVINGRGVRVEGIRGEVFVAPGHIDGWVGRFEPGTKDIAHGDASHLFCSLKGTTYGVDGLP
jgi:hypothetical protein